MNNDFACELDIFTSETLASYMWITYIHMQLTFFKGSEGWKVNGIILQHRVKQCKQL